MTTLTSLIRPADAPVFRVRSGLSAIRGLVVFCISAVLAFSFVFDVAAGYHSHPRNQHVQQALYVM
jgi:hypothetical protein